MLCNGPRLDRPLQPREIELTHLVTGNELKPEEFRRFLGREIQIIDIPNVIEAQPEHPPDEIRELQRLLNSRRSSKG